MQLSAPAKINLHLRVGRVQSDGFHPLVSWMTTIGLFDTLTIDVGAMEAAPHGAPAIALVCDDPSIPCDATNLVYRAARLMLDQKPIGFAVGTATRRLHMHLSKRIPHGGGLGGGSSDGARTLLALNRLLGLHLPTEKLLPLAAKLGSDVPFFLYGPSSICQGRGEIVQPIDRPRVKWATLALPGIAMPTPQVYQVFDALGPGKAQALDDQPPLLWDTGQEWTSLTADELLPRLINDLEPPAFHISPQLGQLRAELEQALGRVVRMSGSGSTLFTLFDDEGNARRAVAIIERRGTRAIAVEIGVIPSDDITMKND